MRKLYKELGHEGRLIVGSFLFVGVCASTIIYSIVKDFK